MTDSKHVIYQIGAWFTTYHHQLAAAVAMICIGGILLGVSMVQFGGSSYRAMLSDESYSIPKGVWVYSIGRSQINGT